MKAPVSLLYANSSVRSDGYHDHIQDRDCPNRRPQGGFANGYGKASRDSRGGNLARQANSARTRRAYRLDVQHFTKTLNITTSDELRQVDHRAVIAWERIMRETEHAAPSTIRRRLSALSSLFKHLVRHSFAPKNPVREIERPTINRDEGTTLAFSKVQARKLLDTPVEDTVEGLRDRAILSVGLQVGVRRAEIASLTVGDLHQNRGFDSLGVTPRRMIVMSQTPFAGGTSN